MLGTIAVTRRTTDGATLRLMGSERAERRQHFTALVSEMPKRPQPVEAFRVIRTNSRTNISPATLCTGIVAAGKHPQLQQQAWNRFRGRVVGAIDAMIVPIPTTLMEAHLAETRDENESNVAELEAHDAVARGDIPAMRRAATLIRQSIVSKQQLAAKLDSHIMECMGAKRGQWA